MNSIIEKNPPTDTSNIGCPLWRRFAAIIYDTLILGCLVFLAWQPVPLLPDDLYPALGRLMRLAYLIAICFLFFGWFWCHGGQTIGMRAWRIKLVASTSSGQSETILPAVTWHAAWLRFISAMLSWAIIGIGFIWALFHHNKLAWHDIFSHTKLIVLSKDQR